MWLGWDRSCLWIPNVQLRAGHIGKKRALSLVVKMSVSQPWILLVNWDRLSISLKKTSQRLRKHLHPASPLRMDGFQTSTLPFQGWMWEMLATHALFTQGHGGRCNELLYLLRPGADMCLFRVLQSELFRARGFPLGLVSAEQGAAQDLMRTPEGFNAGWAQHQLPIGLPGDAPPWQPRSPEHRGVRMNYSSFWMPNMSSHPVLFCLLKTPSLSLRAKWKSTAAGVRTGKAWSKCGPGPGMTWSAVLCPARLHYWLKGRPIVGTGLSNKERHQQSREREGRFQNPARSHLNFSMYVNFMAFWKINYFKV